MSEDVVVFHVILYHELAYKYYAQVHEGAYLAARIIGSSSTVPVVRSINVDGIGIMLPYVSCRITLVEGVDNGRIVGLDRHVDVR